MLEDFPQFPHGFRECGEAGFAGEGGQHLRIDPIVALQADGKAFDMPSSGVGRLQPFLQIGRRQMRRRVIVIAVGEGDQGFSLACAVCQQGDAGVHPGIKCGELPLQQPVDIGQHRTGVGRRCQLVHLAGKVDDPDCRPRRQYLYPAHKRFGMGLHPLKIGSQ